jgi:predicted nuclease of predicted toxin-antitoxin system
MRWALARGYVVFTHDLDFGALLALTTATGPSVIQVRTQDVLPESLGPTVVAALRRFESVLTEGALVTINERTSKARILPLAR